MIFCLVHAFVSVSCLRENKTDDVFNEVDFEIERSSTYQAEKEKRIESFRNDYLVAADNLRRLEIADNLINEYEAYNSDSALHYISLNLQNPLVKEDLDLANELLIKRADILSHAGLFNIAEQTLDDIPRAELDSTLLQKYFAAYAGLYQYQSEYTDDSEFARENERLREAYSDSVLLYADPSSIDYIINYAPAEAQKGNPDSAVEALNEHLKRFSPGEREYSILSSILANVYGERGDDARRTYYLAQSAASDLRGVVKENMAMRALATICFENGDLDRANKYLKQSFADANFYSARMRNAQSSRMLPVIDEAYQARQLELQRRQRLYMIIVSILALVLAVGIYLLFKQIRKVHSINRQKQLTLDELSRLSEQLSKVNEELALANSDLRGANTIKEEYAGLFMEYCSLAISNLQQYHQQLRLLAVQGNVAALMKRLDSSEFVAKTLREFYTKFDDAILNIYPSFVEKFNNLLLPQERVILKSGERLNTELRVFALIRIGINDSEKIAHFLRCSLSTIYTYRSKMKKRAVSPETFENDVLSI